MKSWIMLAGFLAFFACQKQEKTTVKMAYHMTQCADEWMDEAYYDNKEAALTAFLKTKGVEVVSLSIKTDCGTAATCLACTCLGCDQATVEVSPDDVDKMEDLKFTKI